MLFALFACILVNLFLFKFPLEYVPYYPPPIFTGCEALNTDLALPYNQAEAVFKPPLGLIFICLCFDYMLQTPAFYPPTPTPSCVG